MQILWICLLSSLRGFCRNFLASDNYPHFLYETYKPVLQTCGTHSDVLKQLITFGETIKTVCHRTQTVRQRENLSQWASVTSLIYTSLFLDPSRAVFISAPPHPSTDIMLSIKAHHCTLTSCLSKVQAARAKKPFGLDINMRVAG